MAIVLAVGLSVLYDHVIRPLQTASNLLAAMREGDFSLRARANDPDDDLGLLYIEANGLADMLRMQRLDALEAGTLLRAVMAGIDAAVLAFDADGRLLLINRGGEQLLDQAPERAIGRHASELGIGGLPRRRDAARDRTAGAVTLGAPPHDVPPGRPSRISSCCSLM